MNALRTAIRRTAPAATRRFASSGPAVPKAPLPEVYQQQTFKKAFLDDPACYPIIAIMGFISCVVVGMGTHQLLNLKDLRFSSKTKHSSLQNWGEERKDSVASRWANGPMLMHGKEHRSTWREGLGVNHEEWSKQKAAKDAEMY